VQSERAGYLKVPLRERKAARNERRGTQGGERAPPLQRNRECGLKRISVEEPVVGVGAPSFGFWFRWCGVGARPWLEPVGISWSLRGWPLAAIGAIMARCLAEGFEYNWCWSGRL